MKLYLKYLAIQIKGQMEYRTSFMLMCLGQFFIPFLKFIGMLILFQRFQRIGGYELFEVALFFAISDMAFSITQLLARGIEGFHILIRRGELDRILVRPRGVCFQVIAGKFEISKVSRFIQSIMVFIFAISIAQVHYSFMDYMTMLSMVIGGTATFTGIEFIGAALSFKTVESIEIINIFTHGGNEICQYPLTIYRQEVQRFFTYVIPFALMNYIPINHILGRTNGNIILYAFMPLAGILFLIPCYLIWRIGLKYYSSTGS